MNHVNAKKELLKVQMRVNELEEVKKLRQMEVQAKVRTSFCWRLKED
jgi:hypothetical protein